MICNRGIAICESSTIKIYNHKGLRWSMSKNDYHGTVGEFQYSEKDTETCN